MHPSLTEGDLTYSNRTQDTRQQVAIKAVKRDGLNSKLFENLQSEIQILKSLSHRHITKLIDIVVRPSGAFAANAAVLTEPRREPISIFISSWSSVLEET